MIGRWITPRLQRQLRRYPAVALLGPRQVGKTTLARSLLSDETEGRSSTYLDLENPSDLEKLSDPVGYLRSRAGRLVVLDEVQRVPELFRALRGLIDERLAAGDRAGHFLLLGSASLDLQRHTSESLAGRLATLELGGLHVLEVDAAERDMLWARGGFPRSFLAEDDETSVDWRANLVATYLERDVPMLGPRIAAETLRRFWTMLAHRQGALLNSAELARSLGVSTRTVNGYLDLLVDLLLVRRLEPFHPNSAKRLVKSPRTYVRDSGLVHSLLRIASLDELLGHPIAGASWEGFVIETLLAVAPLRTTASFYRTAEGAELDLVLDLPGGQRWAVEVKRAVAPSLTKGFHSAREDVQPERTFVVGAGTERYPKGEGVEVIGLRDLAADLAVQG